MILISLTITINSDQKRSVGPAIRTVSSSPAPSREWQFGETRAMKCTRQVPLSVSTWLHHPCHSLYNYFFFSQSKGTLCDCSCYLTLIRNGLKSERGGQTTLLDHRNGEETSGSRGSRFPELGWRRDRSGTGSGLQDACGSRGCGTSPAGSEPRQRPRTAGFACAGVPSLG